MKFTPCIPKEWKAFKIHYRFGNSIFHLEVQQTGTAETGNVTVDSIKQEDSWVTLIDDGEEHPVLISV